MSCDTWHVTSNMWYMTHDRRGRWTFYKNFSSLAFTVCEWRYFENMFTKHDWVTDHLTNQCKGVSRSAPGRPNVLIIQLFKYKRLYLEVSNLLPFEANSVTELHKPVHESSSVCSSTLCKTALKLFMLHCTEIHYTIQHCTKILCNTLKCTDKGIILQ